MISWSNCQNYIVFKKRNSSFQINLHDLILTVDSCWQVNSHLKIVHRTYLHFRHWNWNSSGFLPFVSLNAQHIFLLLQRSEKEEPSSVKESIDWCLKSSFFVFINFNQRSFREISMLGLVFIDPWFKENLVFNSSDEHRAFRSEFNEDFWVLDHSDWIWFCYT